MYICTGRGKPIPCAAPDCRQKTITAMANRRRLKKEIKQTAVILADECLIYYHFLKFIDEATFDTIIDKIIRTKEEFISRINHPEGTKNHGRTRKYYKTLIEEFSNAVSGIMGELAEKCPKN